MLFFLVLCPCLACASSNLYSSITARKNEYFSEMNQPFVQCKWNSMQSVNLLFDMEHKIRTKMSAWISGQRMRNWKRRKWRRRRKPFASQWWIWLDFTHFIMWNIQFLFKFLTRVRAQEREKEIDREKCENKWLRFVVSCLRNINCSIFYGIPERISGRMTC